MLKSNDRILSDDGEMHAFYVTSEPLNGLDDETCILRIALASKDKEQDVEEGTE